MADIERITRHMAVEPFYSAAISGEDTSVFAAWLPIHGYEKVVAVCTLLTAASNLTNFELVTATTAAGANPTTVATLTTPANINAALETAVMEITAPQIQNVDVDAQYANISINSAGAVPVLVQLFRYRPRYAYATLWVGTEIAWT